MPVLITVDELAERLASDAGHVVLLDVRWQLNGPPGHDEYLNGHLPGAVYVDLDTELAGEGPTSRRSPARACCSTRAPASATAARSSRSTRRPATSPVLPAPRRAPTSRMTAASSQRRSCADASPPSAPTASARSPSIAAQASPPPTRSPPSRSPASTPRSIQARGRNGATTTCRSRPSERQGPGSARLEETEPAEPRSAQGVLSLPAGGVAGGPGGAEGRVASSAFWTLSASRPSALARSLANLLRSAAICSLSALKSGC